MSPRRARAEGFGGKRQCFFNTWVTVVDDVERLSDGLVAKRHVIGRRGDIFDPYVGETLPAVPRDRTDRRRAREDLAGSIGAAGAVHGARSQHDHGKPFALGLPDDVFAVPLAAAVIVLWLAWTILDERHTSVGAVDAG